MGNMLNPVMLNQLLRLNLMGQSGGYRSMQPGFENEDVKMMSPDMLNARLGVQRGGFNAGMSGVLVRLPDGSYMRMRGPVDMGYSMPFMGGQAGVNAAYGPMNDYNLNLSYNRRF